MQRLHADDIVGKLTENKLQGKMLEKVNGWHVLNLAAIAQHKDEFRNIGDVLNEMTEDIDVIKKIETQIGEYFFQAQYQQNPKQAGGGFIKKSQIFFCDDDISQFIQNGVFVSIDSAFKTGENNDFTAITVWAIKKSTVILFDVIHIKMEFAQIQQTIENLLRQYNTLHILVEDKGSGISLIQGLRKKYGSKIVPIKVSNNKEVRFCSALPYLESGQVIFMKNISQNVIQQIVEFPNTKNDDIVDSISQFVNWYFIYRKEYTAPVIREF
jgi:predicted phage terminase large subunit-like protein